MTTFFLFPLVIANGIHILILVNDNGLSPSGWNILQHLNRIGITRVLPDTYRGLEEKKITAIEHAESVAKQFLMTGFTYVEHVTN